MSGAPLAASSCAPKESRLQAITNLAGLGWSPFFAEAFAPYAADGLVPGRVTVQHRGAYVVHTEAGELPAEVTGRLSHEAAGAADLPAVGAWVAASPGDTLLHRAVLALSSVILRILA